MINVFEIWFKVMLKLLKIIKTSIKLINLYYAYKSIVY